MKNALNHAKINSEGEKISKIKSRIKSKSINKDHIKKGKIDVLNPLSNRIQKNINQLENSKDNYKTKKNKKNSNLFFHKRKKKIEINANKTCMKNIKYNKENNKDEHLAENIKVNYNSLDNKKESTNKNHFVKNNYFFQKFKKINKIPNEEVAKNESKEEEKAIMKEKIISENKLNVNRSNENILINEIINNPEEEIKKTESPEIYKENNKNTKSNSKNDNTLLKLNDIK